MSEKQTIEFGLNGKNVSVPANTNQTLLNAVRQLGWCGTKEGCAEGDCGACTVAVLKNGEYQAVNSCLMLAAQAQDLEVWTAEGIGNSENLHAVQIEMANRGGSQCGYCTPGFVMSMFCEYERKRGSANLDEHALVGNLCRCTGYRPIREAMQALNNVPKQNIFFERHASETPSTRAELALPNFYRPDSLQAALTHLAQHPETRIIAGGTDMTLELTTGFKDLGALMSLEIVPELQALRETETHFEIGAAVSLSRLAEEWLGKILLLDQLIPWFASLQIRNRATLGGNIATASPIGDGPPALLALDASVVLASSTEKGTIGRREIPLQDFFLAYRKTALQPGEIIASIRVPKRHSSHPRFEQIYKIAKRGHDDISSVLAAFVLELSHNNVVTHLRLAYGGVAAMPARAKQTETFLLGKTWEATNILAAQNILAQEFTPITDLRASKEYREKIIVNLLQKFFLKTLGQA